MQKKSARPIRKPPALPGFRQLRVRVSQQPPGFGAVNQQAESVGRFLVHVARQLRHSGINIEGIAMVKAGIANNIFKSLLFDPALKQRGVSVKPERVAKAFFGRYPLLLRMLSRHTRTFSSADYIAHWPLEDKILYLTSICSRGTFRTTEVGGKKYRVWTQQILPVKQALDLIEARYKGINPQTGQPKSDIPDKHFEVMREVFPKLEQDLEKMGLDWNRARKVRIPNYIELLSEKPATAK